MANPVEEWKAAKHGFDVWPDIERYAAADTPMAQIDPADLERMKWHGYYYRKRDENGRYMNRIRITANELTADQAKTIALIAYEMGHGIVDVTTRANLQVQGLEIKHLPTVTKRLEAVGLTAKQTGHDNIRNVFGHPFSGVLPGELIDTRPLCHEVTQLFLDSREYSDLPRKLNICFNGTEEHSAHFWTQDLSFLAVEHDGEILFQVLVAGTQGQNPHLAWHLPVLVRPEQVVDVTRSLLDLYRMKGSREKRNAARFRFLVEEIQVAGVLDWLEQTLPFKLLPGVAEPMPASAPDDLVGWFRQRDPKKWTMGLSIPLGRLSWKQLEGLAVLSRRWGDGQLRTTHEQGLAVLNIPTGFKDAAATDAAGLGLTMHADSLERNTVACTGQQFCNIAVTETKGHMFQLIEKLRQRSLKLHGIRIHMSGCPSSCAQHFTADIGLKGVRVRRLLGTREGFDVYLGGGIAGQVHLGLLYKLGVDVDQLPLLIEDVAGEYYLKHRTGQTFSAYWREKLQAIEAAKVGDADYQAPTWVCEKCDHHHVGEDPPVFCPKCAGLRRYYARLDESMTKSADETTSATTRADGFVFAAELAAVKEANQTVTILGKDYALFWQDGNIHAIDSACPHEGAGLADGDVKNCVVSCPWHQWTFDVRTGASIDPPGHQVATYPTLIEVDKVFLLPSRTGVPPVISPGSTGLQTCADRSETCPTLPKLLKPKSGDLEVVAVTAMTHDVNTYRLDNRSAKLPFGRPGQFINLGLEINGAKVWRSFTISSAPTDPDFLDVTIKRNPAGQLTNFLFEHIQAGQRIAVKGAMGGFYFDPDQHTEPLALISAGSGITPMISIIRFLQATGRSQLCTFLTGARTEADILFGDELRQWSTELTWLKSDITLTQPSPTWSGRVGRVDAALLEQTISNLKSHRYFLCGPNAFMDQLQTYLQSAGVPADRIHTEAFHTPAPKPTLAEVAS